MFCSQCTTYWEQNIPLTYHQQIPWRYCKSPYNLALMNCCPLRVLKKSHQQSRISLATTILPTIYYPKTSLVRRDKTGLKARSYFEPQKIGHQRHSLIETVLVSILSPHRSVYLRNQPSGLWPMLILNQPWQATLHLSMMTEGTTVESSFPIVAVWWGEFWTLLCQLWPSW